MDPRTPRSTVYRVPILLPFVHVCGWSVSTATCIKSVLVMFPLLHVSSQSWFSLSMSVAGLFPLLHVSSQSWLCFHCYMYPVSLGSLCPCLWLVCFHCYMYQVSLGYVSTATCIQSVLVLFVHVCGWSVSTATCIQSVLVMFPLLHVSSQSWFSLSMSVAGLFPLLHVSSQSWLCFHCYMYPVSLGYVSTATCIKSVLVLFVHVCGCSVSTATCIKSVLVQVTGTQDRTCNWSEWHRKQGKHQTDGITDTCRQGCHVSWDLPLRGD